MTKTTVTYWPRLLACPFCGGRVSARLVNEKDYWRVSCDAALTCGHSGPALPTICQPQPIPLLSQASAPKDTRNGHSRLVQPPAATSPQAAEQAGETAK